MSSSNQNGIKGKGKGRQKIVMKKIENNNSRQVTFSKRRSGLFKKASEISTLCGAELAIVIFSSGKKCYSFGSPNVEEITKRFLDLNFSPTSNPEKKSKISQQILKLNQITSKVDHEEKRGKELDRVKKPNIGKLDYQKLVMLREAILHFKRKFEIESRNSLGFEDPFFPMENPNLGIKANFGLPRAKSSNLVGQSMSKMGSSPLVLGETPFSHTLKGGVSNSDLMIAYDSMIGSSDVIIQYCPIEKNYLELYGGNFGGDVVPYVCEGNDAIHAGSGDGEQASSSGEFNGPDLCMDLIGRI